MKFHGDGGVLRVDFEQAFVDVAQVLNGEVLVVDREWRIVGVIGMECAAEGVDADARCRNRGGPWFGGRGGRRR